MYQYPIQLNNSLRTIIQKRINHFEGWFASQYPQGVITWTCCGRLVSARSIKRVNFYTLGLLFEVAIFASARCNTCETESFFDGNEVGVVNYDNNHLFAIELLLDMINFKVRDGTPTNTYWNSRLTTLMVDDNMKQSLLRMSGKINQVLVLFLKLIEYPENHMQCCSEPRIVCVDGIVLSADRKRVYASKLSSPWVAGEMGREQRFSTRFDRCLWQLKSEEKILIKVQYH
jgi:hypothetical protein